MKKINLLLFLMFFVFIIVSFFTNINFKFKELVFLAFFCGEYKAISFNSFKKILIETFIYMLFIGLIYLPFMLNLVQINLTYITAIFILGGIKAKFLNNYTL